MLVHWKAVRGSVRGFEVRALCIIQCKFLIISYVVTVEAVTAQQPQPTAVLLAGILIFSVTQTLILLTGLCCIRVFTWYRMPDTVSPSAPTTTTTTKSATSTTRLGVCVNTIPGSLHSRDYSLSCEWLYTSLKKDLTICCWRSSITDNSSRR